MTDESGPVSYPLSLRVEYVRRQTMAQLLFSLAQACLRSEEKGEAWQQVLCFLTGDGDYQATALVDRNGAADEDPHAGH